MKLGLIAMTYGFLMLSGCTGMPPSSGQPSAGGEARASQSDASATRSTRDMPTVANSARARARAHTELGSAYVETGKFGIALDEAKEAIGYDPSYAPAHLLMGQVYAYLEEFDRARAPFEEAARLAPGDPVVNNAYGWYLCNRGKELEGVFRLEQAARNPYYQRQAQAWTNVGTCQLRRKDDRAAESAFQRAVQMDPSNLRALFALSDIAYRDGNYARAREWMTNLMARVPEQTAEVLWLALRIERKLGNRQGEVEHTIKLRRSFAASDEYQALLQGKFD